MNPTPLAPPRLRPARFEDYPQIQQLEAAHGLRTPPADDWRGLWLNNPLWPRLGDRWPIGWALEDPAGRLVGSLSNIPSRYRFRDRDLVCANGRAWVVAAEYRGFALWLMDECFNQPGVDLLINTTVGPLAVDALNTLSVRVPLGDWGAAAFWVTGYCGFAREALRKLGVPLAGALALPAAAALRLKDAFLARRLPAGPASVDVAAAEGFDASFDSFWEELIRQNPDKLLGVRDRQTLDWHFAIPRREGRLWIFTAARNGLLRAYCVLMRLDTQRGLRRMRLVDYQTLEPDTDLLPGLLGLALGRCAAEGFHLLEHLGTGLPKTSNFDRFAPYHRKRANWAYYYQTVDPALGVELRRPEAWDPSEYDGDASLG
jgi:hypothetical protein